VISFCNGILLDFFGQSLAAYAMLDYRFPAQSLMANGGVFVTWSADVYWWSALFKWAWNVGLASALAGSRFLSLFLDLPDSDLTGRHVRCWAIYFRSIPFYIRRSRDDGRLLKLEAFWRIYSSVENPCLFTVFILLFCHRGNDTLFASSGFW